MNQHPVQPPLVPTGCHAEKGTGERHPESGSKRARHVHSLQFWSFLVVIVSCGVGLRLAALDVQSFWYDEAVTDALAQKASYRELLTGQARDNGNPPLYWLVARTTLLLAGPSEAAYRFPSALCGALTILLLGYIGQTWFPPRVALTAAGLLALSPLALELSAEARAYALLHVLVLANLLAFIRWFESRRVAWLLLYAMTMALACLTHYYALLLPVIHLAAIGWAEPKSRTVGAWFLAMLAVAAVALIWLPAFLEQLRQPGNLARMDGRWQLQFLATPLAFGVGRTLAWRTSELSTLGLLSVVLLVVLWIPALWGLFRLRSRRLELVLLGGYWLLPILIPLLLALAGKPLYNVRYASLGLPPFLLLAAWGWSQWAPLPRYLSAATLLALVGASLTNYYTLPLNDDWRSAARVVVDRMDPDELVVVDSDIEVIPLHYYARRYGHVPPRVLAVVEALEDEQNVQGVLFEDGSRTRREPRDFGILLWEQSSFWLALCVPHNEPQEYLRRLSDKGYTLAEQHDFHRITLCHYVRMATDEPRKGAARLEESQ